MVKPLILSSRDIVGGAARATYRLHQALLQLGIESEMLVQVKYGEDDSVIKARSATISPPASLIAKLDKTPLKLYPQRKVAPFSPQWIPERTASLVAQLSPDIINLHWINDGFLRIETLAQLQKPIVWTMHDMWPFTGGCHYNEGCNSYTNSCGSCPLLGSEKEKDLSRWVWNRKLRNWRNLDITIVALSNWLADCARNSSIFGNLPIEIIPNCIDTNVFRPVDKNYARDRLNLPKDKKIVGFGALRATSDPRKGFHLLLPSLEILSESNQSNDLELAIFGASHHNNSQVLALKTRYLGELYDDVALRLFYSAVDAFVLPSTEDNLPNTMMEALACGTPCVAFKIGGIPDMIDHKTNGYLCRPFESRDLAEGISWVLQDDERRQELSSNARQKVLETYSPRIVAHQYLRLYKKLVP